MSTVIITVLYSKNQSTLGYCVSVMKKGREIVNRPRLGTDPGEAAAWALMYQGRYGGGRIVGCREVMAIVNGTG